MLQVSTTLYTVTGRYILRPTWRFTALLTTNTSVTFDQSVKDDNLLSSNEMKTRVENVVPAKEVEPARVPRSNNVMQSMNVNIGNSELSKQIDSVQSVQDLLNLVKEPNISYENIQKIMYTIISLINKGNVEIPNIQEDQRFIRLQNIVNAKESKSVYPSITDNNIHMLSTLSIPSMIHEMAKLAADRRRDIQLLTFFANNIIEYGDVLSVKNCSTLLYVMAVLSFPKEELLAKIAKDLISNKSALKGSIFNSIVTSLGILRYKNEQLLETLCDMILKNDVLLKPSYLTSVSLMFAVLGYDSEKSKSVIKNFILPVKCTNLRNADWINYVWSLTVLNHLKESHAATVLEKQFVDRQHMSYGGISSALRLLNINAAAQYLLNNYEGPLLESDSPLFNITMYNPKQKLALSSVLSETLKSIVPSSSYFATNVDTKMGFMIDALCCMDSENNFVEVDSTNTDSITRIAILVLDYSVYCRGKRDYTGIIELQNRLLQARGYRILHISYEYLSAEDKLIKRLKYLKERIDSLKEEVLI